ncbi:MAG: CBS domain-containing protein [Actinomycetota bacterium]
MRTVRDAMTRTVATASEDTPFKQLVRVMREHRVSAVPVVDSDGSIVGVVSEADLLLKEAPDVREAHAFEGKGHREERRKSEGTVARDLMTHPAVTIGPEVAVTEAARMMHEHRVKRLPVVDAEGRIVGVVSRVDVLADYLRDDAEILDDVRAILRQELLLERDMVTATVEQGMVRLDGEVERRTLLPSIWDRVRAVEGVVGVDERLTWQLDDTLIPVSAVPWVGF